MVALAGLAILHGCIAAVFIEAVIRAGPVGRPDTRLALRIVALLAPFVSVPLSVLLAPWRHSPEFLYGWALFNSASWDNLRNGAPALSAAATAVLSVIGLALFARDSLPALADRVRRTAPDETLPASCPGHERISRVVAPIPVRLGAVALVLLRTHTPVLFCSGWSRPRLTVSAGTLSVLDDEALAAAVVHELQHVTYRDAVAGWLLLLVRALQAFNPATQVVGRQLVEDIEYRADRAVARLGLGPPLARAVAALSDGVPAAQTDLAATSRRRPWNGFADRAAVHATARRCARILAPDGSDEAPGRALAPVAACALAGLLMLVA